VRLFPEELPTCPLRSLRQELILARDGTASPSKPTHSKISSTIQVSASPSARLLGYIINESLS
jgi:hypothetical protein